MAAALLARVGGNASDATAALAAALDGLVQRGREAWPTIQVSTDELVELIAEKVSRDSLESDLAELNPADLHLACGCGRGDPLALAAFEAHYLARVPAALTRLKLDAATVDEVAQILREKLLVAALRTALNLRRTDQRLALDGDEAVVRALEPAPSPELMVMKAHQRDALKRALEDAIASLDARERNVLRLHLAHRLSIDEIGALHRVHRATAARWLDKIRNHLERESRRLLRERLGLDAGEFDSLYRLVESRLELSFDRLLVTGNGPAR